MTAITTDHAIVVRDANKRYGDFVALDHVDFVVPQTPGAGGCEVIIASKRRPIDRGDNEFLPGLETLEHNALYCVSKTELLRFKSRGNEAAFSDPA